MALFPISVDKVQLSTDAPVSTDAFANGILRDAANTVARAATAGGAQFSNGLLRTALGQVVYADATAGLPTGTQFVNGLPLSPLGALCISSDAAVSYSNGIPFAANGAVAAAGLIEPEAAAYAAAVAAVSTPLSAPTIAAVSTWVSSVKAAGAWTAIKDCALMLGSNLAGALVKIKYPVGAPSSLLNTGMTDSNYQFVGGIGWYNGDLNNNQGLDSVATITQLGVGGSDLSMGLLRTDYRDNSPNWMSVAFDTGTLESPAAINDYNPGTADKRGLTGNGPSLRIASVSADAKALVMENGAVVNPFSGSNGGTTTDLGNGHFTIFRARRLGFDFYGTMRAGFYFLGTALTKAQATALSRATRTLYKTLGRIATATECAYIGDSITAGFFVTNPNNRWSTVSSVSLGRWETNFGAPSSSIRVLNSDAAPLIDRYQDIIATAPDEYSVMMGTNDVLTDGNANGDPTIIADCKAKMLTVLTAMKATGEPVRWNGFPYSPNFSLTKATAYEVAFADVARQLEIPYCSQYLRMADTGDTAALLGGDNVHPNDAGMAFLATGDVEMATLKTTRSVTLDFPLVAAGGTQDLNVTMYSAKLASVVSVAPPGGLNAGLTATAVVTANDTVRVRLTNGTGGAIDPASGVFVVTLNF